MSAIRINGIRVGHQMFHLDQPWNARDSESIVPVYRILAEQGKNLPCLGLARTRFGHRVTCCLEQPGSLDPDMAVRPVCIVSVYPHGSRTGIIGRLVSLFAAQGIGFYHMVSSTAMISFVIDQADKDRTLEVLEQTFDLPPTHTPYEPGFQEETAAFVKQRYKETRAYFREQKIKTYGFALEKGLNLKGIRCSSKTLETAGQALWEQESRETARFYFATALGCSDGAKTALYWLDRDEDGRALSRLGSPDTIREAADLIGFHGPHFGDRFGIFNAAADCLDTAGLKLILAGCTGASVTLVVPAGSADAAIKALQRGFDTP